ncbi:hypothetical protein DPMN_137116 [Dreissena polymorpha]|uniref:Uncharacterized protein n=1 Tax=Dreissena polymorpha TaxID=45954 RepID=A0A9D4JHD9_DREPO|nr:hypothetical protein DPMN_137116 [Dreissena polymorpha]
MDSLSRLLPESSTVEGQDFLQTEEYLNNIDSEATPVALSTEEIENVSQSDPELKQVPEILVSCRRHELTYKRYLLIRHEFSSLGFLVLRGTKIVVPTVYEGYVFWN